MLPAPAKPASQLPEPGRLWIHYTPRSWPAFDRPWVHLAGGRLGEWNPGAEAPAFPSLPPMAEAPLDDVLYLPPVPEPLAPARRELARARLAEGTPVLVHTFPGDDESELAAAGAVVIVDLLPAFLEGNLDRALDQIPAAAAAIWPLLAGLTEDPALWESSCRRLAAAGAAGLQAVAPTLAPADRRRLAESWPGDRDEAFDALFHRQCEASAERELACVAYRHGFEPFLPRPLPHPPVLGVANRRIGAVLALAAELWLRIGRPVEQGQALYRAARWIDRTFYDVGALAREGNLAILPPLDEMSRALVAEALHGEPALPAPPELVAELLAEYLRIERPAPVSPASARKKQPTRRTRDAAKRT